MCCLDYKEGCTYTRLYVHINRRMKMHSHTTSCVYAYAYIPHMYIIYIYMFCRILCLSLFTHPKTYIFIGSDVYVNMHTYTCVALATQHKSSQMILHFFVSFLIHVYLHIFIYSNIRVYMICIYRHRFICMFARMRIQMYMCVHVYVPVHICT